MRFYQQNFEDSIKQIAIDMILGQHTQTEDVFDEQLANSLNARINDFTEQEDLNIFIGNWNLKGQMISSHFNLNQKFLQFQGQAIPDVIVFGLQEVEKETGYLD